MSKQRDSNVELLRIIAMLLVLVAHTVYMSIGVPTQYEAIHAPLSTAMRFLFASCSVVCVNAFVMISGWYGIKWHWNRLASILFQTFFYSLLAVAILVAWQPNKYLNTHSLRVIFMLNSSDHWFIKSYVLLFIFSPLLNMFAERATKRELGIFLIAFYTFQTIYGWLFIYAAPDLGGGFSGMSLIGLYMLARYVRLYLIDGTFARLRSHHFFSLYLAITLIQAVVAFILARAGMRTQAARLFTYTNPVAVIQSMALVLAFIKLRPFHSKIINWTAASCLAVYLFHSNELILLPLYAKTVKHWFYTLDGGTFTLYATATIIAVFVVSVLVDKVRIVIWAFVLKPFTRKNAA